MKSRIFPTNSIQVKYKNEYLDKLNSHNFHPRNINLPCLHELTYNKGDVNTYRKATEVVGRHIKE